MSSEQESFAMIEKQKKLKYACEMGCIKTVKELIEQNVPINGYRLG